MKQTVSFVGVADPMAISRDGSAGILPVFFTQTEVVAFPLALRQRSGIVPVAGHGR
jgi:hypothetical protein